MRSIHALIALAAVTSSAAGQPDRLRIDPRSKITILGTSNVHKWDCSTSAFTAIIDAPHAPGGDIGKEVTKIDVTIPVKSLDCGERKMNENLRKAMRVEQHPNVEFSMTSYATGAKTAGAYEATIAGRLTINGVTKPVELKATVTPDGKGGVRAEGSTEIRTPDHDVAPVKALLGTVRTGERVTIVVTIIATHP